MVSFLNTLNIACVHHEILKLSCIYLVVHGIPKHGKVIEMQKRGRESLVIKIIQ